MVPFNYLVSDAKCHERVFAIGVRTYNNTYLDEYYNVYLLPNYVRKGWGDHKPED